MRTASAQFAAAVAAQWIVLLGTAALAQAPSRGPTALPPVAHSTSDTASDTGPPKSATANKQDPNWMLVARLRRASSI